MDDEQCQHDDSLLHCANNSPTDPAGDSIKVDTRRYDCSCGGVGVRVLRMIVPLSPGRVLAALLFLLASCWSAQQRRERWRPHTATRRRASHAGVGQTCAVTNRDRVVFCWGLSERLGYSRRPKQGNAFSESATIDPNGTRQRVAGQRPSQNAVANRSALRPRSTPRNAANKDNSGYDDERPPQRREPPTAHEHG